MKGGQPGAGAGWYLGTVQYCVCLFGGGAAWFVAAALTGFFWDDPLAQSGALALLAALIAAESWWAHIPTRNEGLGDWLADLFSSAAIAAFGMAIVFAIVLVLSRGPR